MTPSLETFLSFILPEISQTALFCIKSIMETPEQYAKSVQS